jgi:hypothetical protein
MSNLGNRFRHYGSIELASELGVAREPTPCASKVAVADFRIVVLGQRRKLLRLRSTPQTVIYGGASSPWHHRVPWSVKGSIRLAGGWEGKRALRPAGLSVWNALDPD